MRFFFLSSDDKQNIIIILQKDVQFLKCYFNSLFDEVHREEDHHEVYRDVRFLYRCEQSLKRFYHYQARKTHKTFF